MPIDITEAQSNRFHSELWQEPPRRISAGRTESRQLTRAMEWTVIQSMAIADSSLRLGQHLGLGVFPTEDSSNHFLHRQELGMLSPRACRRKQIEFASGRAAANFALNQIGCANSFPILRGPKGEPVWPDRIVGSITHCYPWNVAVAAKCSNPLAIGVDLETTERAQGTDISELICNSMELEWVRAGNLRERLTMIFSAKEAVYKAFYPLCRRYIDFKDVELTWAPAQSCFQGKFLASFGSELPRGHVCAVHCHSYAEFVFSCVIHRPQ